MAGRKSKIKDHKKNTRWIILKLEILGDIKSQLRESREGSLHEITEDRQKICEWKDRNGVVLTLDPTGGGISLHFKGDEEKTNELVNFICIKLKIDLKKSAIKDEKNY